MWHLLRRAVAEARDDDVPMVARALAYSLFLAIPAAALLALGLSRGGEWRRWWAREVMRGGESSSATAWNGHTVAGGGLAMTIAGLVLALWTTTSAASTLMSATTRRSIGRTERLRAEAAPRTRDRAGTRLRCGARALAPRLRAARGALGRRRDGRPDARRLDVVDAPVAAARRRHPVRVRRRARARAPTSTSDGGSS